MLSLVWEKLSLVYRGCNATEHWLSLRFLLRAGLTVYLRLGAGMEIHRRHTQARVDGNTTDRWSQNNSGEMATTVR
jgi:hypothetical protein